MGGLLGGWVGGWVVGWVVGWGKSKLKLNSAQLELELGLSLAKVKKVKKAKKVKKVKQAGAELCQAQFKLG
jgi:hypothetical protein